jgi:S-formylglutathione hydrolase FrmB
MDGGWALILGTAGSFGDISLLTGAVPWLVTVGGFAGGLWLLCGRRRWFLRVAVPMCAAVTVVVAGGVYVVVEKLWRPFPDPVEKSVYLWITFGIAGLVLMAPRLFASRRWVPRAVTVGAVAAVLATAAIQINLVYAAYPTLRDALGTPRGHNIAFADLPGPAHEIVSGRALDSVWHAPRGMVDTGSVSSAAIPGPVSGFHARDASFYFPPAYFTDPRPLLPVLVLLPGQPGGPSDWLTSGRVADTMDAFARAHSGLSPVVVVADATGSALGNPLCVDSRLGNVATYLGRDLPAWTTAHLQVDPDPRAWAIGGLSYGGTCALQMATTHPEVYPTFLDLSGQQEPTLGDRTRTLNAAFGGDSGAFARVNPLDILASRHFPGSAGAFVVGASDREFGPGQRRVFAAAKAAGMDVTYTELAGGHSWSVWSAALRTEIGWLATHVGLTR